MYFTPIKRLLRQSARHMVDATSFQLEAILSLVCKLPVGKFGSSGYITRGQHSETEHALTVTADGRQHDDEHWDDPHWCTWAFWSVAYGASGRHASEQQTHERCHAR